MHVPYLDVLAFDAASNHEVLAFDAAADDFVQNLHNRIMAADDFVQNLHNSIRVKSFDAGQII